VADVLARVTPLQPEIVRPSKGVTVDVLMVEIVDLERHAKVLRGYHFLTPSASP